MAKAQVDTRIPEALSPGHDYEKEYKKGEIAGISLFMKIPEVAIENLRLQVEEEDEQDSTTDDAA